jgi:hypothetical protein
LIRELKVDFFFDSAFSSVWIQVDDDEDLSFAGKIFESGLQVLVWISLADDEGRKARSGFKPPPTKTSLLQVRFDLEVRSRKLIFFLSLILEIF